MRDDETRRVIIGRKASLFSREGFRGALHVGRVEEEGPLKGYDVYVDALYPHVIFVAGARGSGKSYTLGVFVEELAEKNPYVGVVVIDPVGIYWSMKLPNRQSEEIRALTSWGLTPKGYDNVKIFIPVGAAGSVPENTYDALFALKPSMLTVDDWALTFGIDRFSPSGMLLEKVLESVRKEYGDDYSLEDIIAKLEKWEELRDKEKGFKPETIRALLSRFYAARSWGVFSDEGTPLTEISKPGIVSVIDVSFLEENVGALVIGVLARRILHARKIATRKEAAKILNVHGGGRGETDIPPTWLVIDEAHILIPAGNRKTPATDALIEYVKQGRRPGCSLLFATQQPAAIDSRVLSQLDLLFVHKLVFSDDVKAVEKRMPTVLPKEYAGVFLKRLPIGVALVGDRADTTSRAFLVRIRPRRSQHEGREIAVDMTVAASPPPEQSEGGKKERGTDNNMAIISREREEGPIRARAVISRIMEDKARSMFKSYGKGIIGRIFGGGNEIVSLEVKFIPVWEVTYSVFAEPRRVETGVTYIDGYHGEFIHVNNKGKIFFSRGLKHIYKLPRNQTKIIAFLYHRGKEGATLSEIIARGHVPADLAERDVELLKGSQFIREENGRYFINMDLMLPLDPTMGVLASFGRLLTAETQINPDEVLPANFGKERVKELLPALWGGVIVKNVSVIYRPVWLGIIKRGGRQYKVMLDAVTGVFEKELPVLEGKKNERR
ncbi:MAG: hypothetical protein PWP76_398 [Candidatus Diapherotrites archaeon]|nr:hypothetical protein [Candidatus Diapherotrites archaeon]